ncbi:hypothetical protein ACTJIL_10165 [Luteimonas sp. 22616]|uniref:hypothetical protein n=1 Tax=Luteimonas sp. 22616 TaxID=3453951 RepID=UPI003F82DF80
MFNRKPGKAPGILGTRQVASIPKRLDKRRSELPPHLAGWARGAELQDTEGVGHAIWLDHKPYGNAAFDAFFQQFPWISRATFSAVAIALPVAASVAFLDDQNLTRLDPGLLMGRVRSIGRYGGAPTSPTTKTDMRKH